jgi:hypothetical protein
MIFILLYIDTKCTIVVCDMEKSDYFDTISYPIVDMELA